MKSSRKPRILTGLGLAILIVLAIFAVPPSVFFVLCLALFWQGSVELVRILRFWAPGSPLGLLLILWPMAAVALAWASTRDLSASVILTLTAGGMGMILAAILVVVWSATPMAEATMAIGFGTFLVPYLALPTVSLYHLHNLDPWLVLGVLILVALADTVAYFIGSWIGRHKLAPTISPNKTWEGSIAGFLAAIAGTAVWSTYRYGEVYPEWLVVAAATAVAAQLGDLAESLIKRGAGVKDSSRLLPGHGGIYDRIDATLLAAPVFLVGVLAFGLDQRIATSGVFAP